VLGTFFWGRGGSKSVDELHKWFRSEVSFRSFRRLEFKRITAQQTQVHLRLSWGSVHGSLCSNIELDGLT
jgi:hypothetical protein